MIKYLFLMLLLSNIGCQSSQDSQGLNNKNLGCDPHMMFTPDRVVFNNILVNLITGNSNLTYDDGTLRKSLAEEACLVYRQYKLTFKENF